METCIKSRKIVLLKDRILLPTFYKEVTLYRNKQKNVYSIITSLDVPDDWNAEMVRRARGEIVYPCELDILELDEYHLILMSRDRKSVVIINYYYGENFRKVVNLNRVKFFETCLGYGDRFRELEKDERNKTIELSNNTVCFYRADSRERVTYLGQN